MNHNSKKALIIAPHPDDEINLAGQLIVGFVNSGIDVYIVYTTNGDYTKKIGNSRLYEAINALAVLGVPDKNICFLGYGNEWLNGNHIYNFRTQNDILTSLSGKTETSGIPTHPEYSMQKYGCHHSFTRENYKTDLKGIILDIKATYLICNDFDSHIDHKATSLIFEEVIGEILNQEHEYEPIILKKFAYSGVWKGSKDYYNTPMKETINTISGNINGILYDTESPYYKWDDRIRIKPPTVTLTHFISNNILFKAAKKHKSQIAWYQMLRVINSDIVYWWRPTCNLLKYANIATSSGNKKYLNDFKLYESSDLQSGLDNLNINNYMWVPDNADKEKGIEIFFENAKRVEMIRIYGDYCPDNYLKSVVIIINDDERLFVNENPSKPYWDIYLSEDRVLKLKIKIMEWNGIPGIVELELFDHKLDFFKNNGNIFEEYKLNNAKYRGISVMQIVEKMWLNICLLFSYKLKIMLRNIFYVK